LSTIQNFRGDYERRVKANGHVLRPSFDPGKAVAAAASIAGRPSEHFGNQKGTVS